MATTLHNDGTGGIQFCNCCVCPATVLNTITIREYTNPDNVATGFLVDESLLFNDIVPTTVSGIGAFTRWLSVGGVGGDADIFIANGLLQLRGRRWEFGHEFAIGELTDLKFAAVYRDGGAGAAADVGIVQMEIWSNSGLVTVVDLTTQFNSMPTSAVNDPTTLDSFSVDVSALGPIKSIVLKQGSLTSDHPSWIRIGEIQPTLADCNEPCTGYSYCTPQSFTLVSDPYLIDNFSTSGTGTGWSSGTTSVVSSNVITGAGSITDNLDGTVTYNADVTDSSVQIEVDYSNTGAPAGCTANIISLFTVCVGTATPSMVIDTAPTNPCICSTVLSYTVSDPCVSVTAQALNITHAGGTAVLAAPAKGNNIDLSDYQGETVTVEYSVTTSCGTFSVSDMVTVPTFNREITVNPALPQVGDNYQTVTDGIGASVSGDRVTIEPGTYSLNAGGEATAISIFSRTNLCVTTPSGVAIIDGAASAFTNGIWRCSGAAATNNYFANIHVQNGTNRNFYMEQTSGHVYENCSSTNCTVHGFRIIDSDNMKVIGGTFDNNGNAGINVEGEAASATRSSNILIDCVTCNDNGGDGVLIKKTDGITIQNSSSFMNGRQGILPGDTSTNIRVTNCDLYQNVTTGIQIENECDTVRIDNNRIHDNNLGNATPPPFNCGETGIWIDDSVSVIVEFNEIYGNHGAIRIDGDGTSAPVGQVQTSTENCIIRYNKIYDNTGSTDSCGDGIGLALGRCSGVYVYNNTMLDNGSDDAFVNSDFAGLLVRVGDGGGGTPIGVEYVFDTRFKNNIIAGQIPHSTVDTYTVQIEGNTSSFSEFDNNIYFDPPSATAYSVTGVDNNFTNYQTAVAPFEANSVEADPLLTPVTLVPGVGSPALGNAVTLTDITGIAGTNITLTAAGYFAVGDIVEFDNASTATISAIAGNIITVDAVPAGVAMGQGITFHNCDGVNDIGAVQVA